MNFLKKHVLFPTRFGISPYFWIIFSVPIFSQILQFDSIFKWLLMINFFIFLKAYRDGYVVTSKLSFYITVQLIVACFLGLVLQNGVLFILTAWEIGSLPVNKGTFRNYLVMYYLFSAISLGVMLFSTSWESESIVIGSVITVIAAIGSPLAAKAVSESYRRLYRLDQQNKRLEAIIRQNERERIARDLHDNLGQAFSLITLKAELANKLVEIDSEKAKRELLDITETSRKNLSLVRKIVTNLQERTIAKTLLEEEKHLSVAAIELLTEGEEIAEDWPIKTQDVLSAVIKEAVTNMIRHSRASTAKIQFTEKSEEYHVLIQDDGQGFKEVRPEANGLFGMEKRIQAVNGLFSIKGTTGTQIYITLPKEKTID